MQFPQTRLRRNRISVNLRNSLREIDIRANELILPLFIKAGSKEKEVIKTLPGIYRYSIDQALNEVEKAEKLGITMLALFPEVEKQKKTQDCVEAYNDKNLVCLAIKEIKRKFPEMIIIADVALDPYNSLGHDGLVEQGEILNDQTLQVLAKQAAILAYSGADILAPSDMMDGRIGFIRKELDHRGFYDKIILSYAAKYSSHLYGPFRDAIGSDTSLQKSSKATYQMDFHRKKEALIETEMDIAEGADIVMIKPASFYLDIINDLSEKIATPIFAYQVSGELAMLKFASQNGCFDYQQILHENLVAIKRSGAKAIFCYDAISYLENN